jgi:hypothetical protein
MNPLDQEASALLPLSGFFHQLRKSDKVCSLILAFFVPQLSGFLTRRTKLGGVGGRKRLWFVQIGPTFYYYNRSEDAVPLGAIPFSDILQVTQGLFILSPRFLSHSRQTFLPLQKVGTSAGFDIVTTDCVFKLEAEGVNDAKAWVAGLPTFKQTKDGLICLKTALSRQVQTYKDRKLQMFKDSVQSGTQGQGLFSGCV